MIEDIVKTIYLCSGARPGSDYVASDSGNRSISVDSDDATATVSIPLSPVGTVINDKVDISLFLQPVGTHWADKYKPTFTWEMMPFSLLDNPEPPYWIASVKLDFTIPEGCDWIGSQVVKNELGSILLETLTAVQPPAAGVIPDSKSDVSLVDDWNHTAYSTNLLPGDLLRAVHTYRVADNYESAGRYFRTAALAGGIITSRASHPLIPNLLVYTIDIEGVSFPDVLPTDYYLHNVGDVVEVLTIRSASTDLERRTLTPEMDLNASVRLTPPLSLSFGQRANMLVLVSTITRCEQSANLNPLNQADISNAAGDFTNVSIKYFCVDQSQTDSRLAFKENDSVLVLWHPSDISLPSATDMTIIGHTGYVYPCTTTTTTTTTSTSTSTTSTTTTGGGNTTEPGGGGGSTTQNPYEWTVDPGETFSRTLPLDINNGDAVINITVYGTNTTPNYATFFVTTKLYIVSDGYGGYIFRYYAGVYKTILQTQVFMYSPYYYIDPYGTWIDGRTGAAVTEASFSINGF